MIMVIAATSLVAAAVMRPSERMMLCQPLPTAVGGKRFSVTGNRLEPTLPKIF